MTEHADPALEAYLNGLIEFGTHLPVDKQYPIEVAILRGHLLIQGQLVRLIEAKFANPKAIDVARLPFSTLLRLAQAMCGSAAAQWVWEETKQLNVIRNSLAHTLRDDTLEPRMTRFVEAFKKRLGDEFKLVKGGVAGQMAHCVACIHTELLRVRKS